MTANDLARFELSADAKTVIDKTTGRSWTTREAVALMFARDDPVQENAMPQNYDYFSALGRAISKRIADETLSAHLSGPTMAKDQAMPYDQNYSNTMPVRGGRNYDQDPETEGGGEGSSEVDKCIQTVQYWLENVPPDQHDELVAKLAEIIQMAHGMGAGDQGLPRNNTSALDRGRSGGRSRRPGMDSAIRGTNTASFLKRFPFMNDVIVGGVNGRG